jgi:hypothetical protein
MAAEDWIDLDRYYYDEDYAMLMEEGYPDEGHFPEYTDKFTFNGKRKRTKFQRVIVRDNKLLYGENW